MQVSQLTSQAPSAMKSGQRNARDQRSTLSLLVGCEAGQDIVAMVTIEHAGAHVDWEALVWRGPVVWMEVRGTCADVPDVIEAQIRQRVAEGQTRSRAHWAEKLTTRKTSFEVAAEKTGERST